MYAGPRIHTPPCRYSCKKRHGVADGRVPSAPTKLSQRAYVNDTPQLPLCRIQGCHAFCLSESGDGLRVCHSQSTKWRKGQRWANP